ncbi:MAG TPA: zinc ribbon domain-containing protein [Vicinamibacteria bacterium]|nr:zinc ribbon domain-containing protein [Vicinamibacteria bacterium]
MSRFDQEFALVPTGARWTAALVVLAFAALMAGIFLVPVTLTEPRSLPFVLPVFLASLLGAAFLGAFVLLVGYVFADARRRGMNHVLWTLLAIFIPNAIGIILYFILRDPIPVPCPACGTPARKGHAFCAGCGAAVRAACPQCRQPIETGWRNCARCGAALTGASPLPTATP